MYITNRYDNVRLPYEPDLLAWLQANYPHSQYHIKETENVR